jgi:hypothetical protein
MASANNFNSTCTKATVPPFQFHNSSKDRAPTPTFPKMIIRFESPSPVQKEEGFLWPLLGKDKSQLLKRREKYRVRDMQRKPGK